MEPMTASDLAQRAAVPAAFVERLVELGILAPREDGRFGPGDLHRTRLLRSSERAGLPLEAIAAALATGQFSLGFPELPPLPLVGAVGHDLRRAGQRLRGGRHPRPGGADPDRVPAPAGDRVDRRPGRAHVVRATVGDGVRFSDIGLVDLKGIPQPVRAYQALPGGDRP